MSPFKGTSGVFVIHVEAKSQKVKGSVDDKIFAPYFDHDSGLIDGNSIVVYDSGKAFSDFTKERLKIINLMCIERGLSLQYMQKYKFYEWLSNITD